MTVRALRYLWTLTLTPMAFMAQATEGGMGRPITGQMVFSDAGVVPPGPGWIAVFSSIAYQGDLGGSRMVPLNRTLSLGVDATAVYNIANLSYVWDTHAGAWNFASGVGVPVQYTQVKANVGGTRLGLEEDDSNTRFADVLLTPFIAGYHLSKTEHIAMSVPFYAPTGSYDPNRLANAGQNTWTFMPTIAYTRLLESGGEFTALTAVEFYTRNKDTDYKNGALFRIDAMWTTRIAAGWNLGAVGGWIQQLQKDSGPTADALNGFKGYAVGLGPIVTWSGKFGSQPASFSARWVHDIDTKNRPKGDGVSVSLTLPFL